MIGVHGGEDGLGADADTWATAALEDAGAGAEPRVMTAPRMSNVPTSNATASRGPAIAICTMTVAALSARSCEEDAVDSSEDATGESPPRRRAMTNPQQTNPQHPCAVGWLSSICSFAVSNSNERRDGFKEGLGLSKGSSPSSMWLEQTEEESSSSMVPFSPTARHRAGGQMHAFTRSISSVGRTPSEQSNSSFRSYNARDGAESRGALGYRPT